MPLPKTVKSEKPSYHTSSRSHRGSTRPTCIAPPHHPGGNPGGNLVSISHRCYLREVAFGWELTKETIYLPLGCLQGGVSHPKEAVSRDLSRREGGGAISYERGTPVWRVEIHWGRARRWSEWRWTPLHLKNARHTLHLLALPEQISTRHSIHSAERVLY